MTENKRYGTWYIYSINSVFSITNINFIRYYVWYCIDRYRSDIDRSISIRYSIPLKFFCTTPIHWLETYGVIDKSNSECFTCGLQNSPRLTFWLIWHINSTQYNKSLKIVFVIKIFEALEHLRSSYRKIHKTFKNVVTSEKYIKHPKYCYISITLKNTYNYNTKIWTHLFNFCLPFTS